MEKGKALRVKQSIESFCSKYKDKEEIQQLKNSVKEISLENNTFLTSLCSKKVFDSAQKCQLVLNIKKSSECFLGFLAETKGFGFNFYPEDSPSYKEIEPIGRILDVQAKGRKLILKFNSKYENIWQLQFETIGLTRQWKEILGQKIELASGKIAVNFKTELKEKQKISQNIQISISSEIVEQINKTETREEIKEKNPGKKIENENKFKRKQIPKSEILIQKAKNSKNSATLNIICGKNGTVKSKGENLLKNKNDQTKEMTKPEDSTSSETSQIFILRQALQEKKDCQERITNQLNQRKIQMNQIESQKAELHSQVTLLNIESQKFSNTIKKKQSQIRDLKEQNENIHTKLKIQEKSILQFEQNQETSSAKTKQKDEEIQTLKKCYEESRKAVELMKEKQLQWQKEKQNTDTNQQDKLRQLQTTYLLELKEIKDQLEFKQNEAVEKKEIIKTLTRQKQSIKSILEEKIQQNQKELDKKIEEYQKIHQKLIIVSSNLEEEKHKREKQELFMQEQLQKQQIKLNKLCIQLNEKETNITLLQKEVVIKTDELSSAKSQLAFLQEKNLQLMAENQKFQHKVEETKSALEQTLYMKESTISTLTTELESHKLKASDSIQMERDSMALEEELTLMKQKYEQLLSRIFFVGKLLDNQPREKQFLQNSVEKVKQKHIIKTIPIYKSDPLNTTSFHKYVDQVPDIALIVKTQSGMIFAAFSESPISNTKAPNKGGVIMSLTNKLSFELTPGKRSVTYDTYFLIFGNSEIRIKHGEWKVFANFGIANGFYMTNGGNVNDLLGAGKERQVKIIDFEVHQVLFD